MHQKIRFKCMPAADSLRTVAGAFSVVLGPFSAFALCLRNDASFGNVCSEWLRLDLEIRFEGGREPVNRPGFLVTDEHSCVKKYLCEIPPEPVLHVKLNEWQPMCVCQPDSSIQCDLEIIWKRLTSQHNQMIRFQFSLIPKTSSFSQFLQRSSTPLPQSIMLFRQDDKLKYDHTTRYCHLGYT